MGKAAKALEEQAPKGTDNGTPVGGGGAGGLGLQM